MTLVDEVNRTLFFTDVPPGTLKPKDIPPRKPATSIAEAFHNLTADLDSAIFFTDLASIARSVASQEGEETKEESKEETEPKNRSSKDRKKRRTKQTSSRKMNWADKDDTGDEFFEEYYEMNDDDLIDYMSDFLDSFIDGVAEGVDPVLGPASDKFEKFAFHVRNMAGNDHTEYLRMNQAMKEAQKRRVRKGLKGLATVKELHDNDEEPMLVIEGETEKQRHCRGLTVGPPSVQRLKKKHEKEEQLKHQVELLAAQQKAELTEAKRKELFKFLKEQDAKEEAERKASKAKMRQKTLLEMAMDFV
jgi:hypothetical protein